MYDFSKILEDNEEILWEGKPVVRTGLKQIGGLLFLLLFSLTGSSLLIWSVWAKVGDGESGINLDFILLFGIFLFFAVIALYNIIYVLFLKNKKIANEYYCITNQRALRYEGKKDELIYGYIQNYDVVITERVEGKYGDVVMSVAYDDNADIYTIIQKQDSCNRRQMHFQCIEDPRKIARMIKNIKKGKIH